MSSSDPPYSFVPAAVSSTQGCTSCKVEGLGNTGLAQESESHKGCQSVDFALLLLAGYLLGLILLHSNHSNHLNLWLLRFLEIPNQPFDMFTIPRIGRESKIRDNPLVI